jgi:hypothetical protein
MGFLLKFILVTILIIWLLGKIAKFFLKSFLAQQLQNMANQQQQRQQPKYPEGSIHIDSVPNQSGSKKPKDNLGGDYVDYEVVK